MHGFFFIESPSSPAELQTMSSSESCMCSSLVLFLGIRLGTFAAEVLLDFKLDR